MLLAILTAGAIRSATADDCWVTHTDTIGNALARLTDPGADGPFDPESHRLIDLRELTIGKWAPDEPAADLFTGDFHASGKFVRLDVLLEGHVNPPGLTYPWQFEPFAYGPDPVFGFIEVDMDQDVETGGELDAPEYRYVGNAVRFGSKPAERAELGDRIALDATAFDGDFLSAPYVDRSGEEFHLALLGSVFTAGDIVEIVGDGDGIFDAGETWWIEAPWFHRAHGYEPFSLAAGGGCPGEYAPRCTLQFEHDPLTDVTQISLVFPLKNAGAGLMWGESPEPPNGDPSDQFSVFEALEDLHDSAVFLDQFPTGLPEEAIITEWQSKEADDFLLPTAWEITALLGTSYTVADPAAEYFVWSDVYPNGVRGDVNGDGDADQQDLQLIQQYIADEDAGDGVVDGRVELADFALNFSVFDINHDGVVGGLDVLLVRMSNLANAATFRRRFFGAVTPVEP